MSIKEDFYNKKCFGKNKCWTNIRKKCSIRIECSLKAKAGRMKKKCQSQLFALNAISIVLRIRGLTCSVLDVGRKHILSTCVSSIVDLLLWNASCGQRRPLKEIQDSLFTRRTVVSLDAWKRRLHRNSYHLIDLLHPTCYYGYVLCFHMSCIRNSVLC